MQQKEEQDPLFYNLPLPRLLNWNRWWHLIAKTVQLVYKKKTWSAIGSLLKRKKGVYTERVVFLWKAFSRRSLELKRIKHLPDEELVSLIIAIDMTESNVEHPTAGRRRASVHASVALPVPRLADHIDTEIAPSDEEGEKEAKRQRSEPTTPISTSSRLLDDRCQGRSR